MDYDFAGFNLIIERYRIASALESDSGEVDGDIALLADDLAILLVIARVTAVVTCVKTDTVRSTIFLMMMKRITVPSFALYWKRCR